ELNQTGRPIPDQVAAELFQQQAKQTPKAVAIRFEQERLTYRELNLRANRLAHHLGKLGVGPETLVGVYLERSTEMVVALLGILKAGGAYLPLDPAYPQERLAFMLEDSGVKVLLTQQRLLGQLPAHQARTLCLDADWERISRERAANPVSKARMENLAYVIYTSGSTGRPKGVEITQRALVNFLHSMRNEPGLGPDDVLVAVTTLSFDIAGLEMFLPLTVGAQVVIAGRDVAADGHRLLKLMEECKATAMQATPATW